MRAWAGTLVVVLVTWTPGAAGAWGLTAHRWVARRAVELVGNECGGLIADQASKLANLAVEPDTVLRARHGRREKVRHFLDLDAYGPPPFAALPRRYDEAVRRHGRELVRERGVLPWHVGRLARRLRDQAGRREWSEARTTAGYLAHYVADATMPLHATRNHDGQMTRQRGLHARLERGLVDDHFEAFAALARQVPAGPSIAPAAAEGVLFATLETSQATVARVLAADHAARRGTRAGSAHYYERMDADLRRVLAQRLGAAAALTASLWRGACQGAPTTASRDAPP